ncbi:MAG TPA: hypothetical protein VK522_19190 [Pseudolabrys sp.]|nr:hypothetical protein [Pseudolabrys sp.]
MALAQLLVDLLKGLAWPAVALILGFLFKTELRSLFPRIIKAGPGGIELDREKQRIPRSTGELQELPGLQRTAKMAEIEKSIHQALELYDSNKQVDLLVRHLAQSRLETVFERIYGAIFGSQILGLRALANTGGGSVSKEEAIKFFDDVKSKYPEFYGKSTFEDWISFLRSFELVRDNGNSVEITELGRDFLLYLTARGLSENKNW